MTEREAKIVNQLGLHARPAAQLVRAAASFACDIRLEKDDMEVNGKSIMGVMMLAAGIGQTITLRADGPDESSALAAMADLFARKFDEGA